MRNPRRGFNNNPPYAPRPGQYPSQSAEYRTQQFGGQQAQQPQNSGFYEDRTPQPNVPHFYQNKSPAQESQRHRPYGQGRGFGRGGGGNFGRRNFPNRPHNQQNRGNNNQEGGPYFHRSMLEDPWRELVERHEAKHGSGARQAGPEAT
ncbi:hypothetical protein KR018_004086 [Drosophila ironensis]|nr:hypothetical protein KR018_004086 [Drosophila ironensis]